MFSFRWLQWLRSRPLFVSPRDSLRALGIEFWLPLPLLGLLFWAASSLAMQQLLQRSEHSAPPLQVAESRELPSQQVMFIKVEIDREQGTSQVKVKTVTREFREHEFSLPTTELSQIEGAIAQHLKLPPDQVSELIRYQVKD